MSHSRHKLLKLLTMLFILFMGNAYASDTYLEFSIINNSNEPIDIIPYPANSQQCVSGGPWQNGKSWYINSLNPGEEVDINWRDRDCGHSTARYQAVYVSNNSGTYKSYIGQSFYHYSSNSWATGLFYAKTINSNSTAVDGEYPNWIKCTANTVISSNEPIACATFGQMVNDFHSASYRGDYTGDAFYINILPKALTLSDIPANNSIQIAPYDLAVSGTGAPGYKLEEYLEGPCAHCGSGHIYYTDVHSTGNWADSYGSLPVGEYTYHIRYKGQSSDADLTRSFSVKEELESINIISINGQNLVPSVLSGAKILYAESVVTIKGTKDPQAILKYNIDGANAHEVNNNITNWSIESLYIGSYGRHSIEFYQTRDGEDSDQKIKIKLDIIRPDTITVPQESSSVLDHSYYLIKGTGEPGGIIQVSLSDGWYPLESAVVAPNGVWQAHGPSSGDGEYEISTQEIINGEVINSDNEEIKVVGSDDDDN